MGLEPTTSGIKLLESRSNNAFHKELVQWPVGAISVKREGGVVIWAGIQWPGYWPKTETTEQNPDNQTPHVPVAVSIRMNRKKFGKKDARYRNKFR